MHIGLTGGIGSGKSTVATMFACCGATVIDIDAISRRLTAAGGAGIPALREAFGDEILSAYGALDREAMRALAFSDPTVKHRLEAVLHPRIGAEALRDAADAAGGIVVFDVPLLAESLQWRERVDRVLVVDCRPATQIERVMLRSGWTRDLVERVISSQASRATRRAVADAVIFNDGITLATLDAAVCKLWQLWQSLPQSPVEQ